MSNSARELRILCCGITCVAGAHGCLGASFLFANTNSVEINDSQTPPTKATPYPLTNVVSGLTGLVVTKVTVTLQGFSHGFPSDVSMLLVGPQGQEAIVMSEVGGQMQYSVTNLTLTLDDEATNSLPVYTSLATGTFKPTNGYLVLGYRQLPYDFPSPAPPRNSNAVSAFSAFKDTDPEGTWKLFVVDDASGNSGSISRGWNLNIDAAVPLSIARAQTNVVVSWTNAVSGCALQSAPGLSGPWTNVAPGPVVVSGRYTVTNRVGPGGVYYRLIK